MTSNPYAAPTSTIAGFRDQRAQLERLARRRDAFLVANLGYAVVLTLPLLGIGPARQDWAVSIASGLEVLAFVAFAVSLLRVVAIAHHNATAIRGAVLPFTSTMLAGSFLVPIANLVLPFLGIRTLWRASTAAGESPSPTPQPLAHWWVLWIGACAFATMWRALIHENHDLAFVLSWCATLTSTFAALVAYRCLRELDARQCAVSSWRPGTSVST